MPLLLSVISEYQCNSLNTEIVKLKFLEIMGILGSMPNRCPILSSISFSLLFSSFPKGSNFTGINIKWKDWLQCLHEVEKTCSRLTDPLRRRCSTWRRRNQFLLTYFTNFTSTWLSVEAVTCEWLWKFLAACTLIPTWDYSWENLRFLKDWFHK